MIKCVMCGRKPSFSGICPDCVRDRELFCKLRDDDELEDAILSTEELGIALILQEIFNSRPPTEKKTIEEMKAEIDKLTQELSELGVEL